MSEPPPPAAPAREEHGRTTIARELGGNLPCARCRYNLKGLSIRAVCPECGLPVRATVLAVVDPKAHELRPVRYPWVVAAGIICWSFGALGAAIWTWVFSIVELTGSSRPVGWVTLGPVLLAGVSGLGAMVLIRPHAGGVPTLGSRAAMLGVMAYIPLLAVLYYIHIIVDPVGIVAYGPKASSDAGRLLSRLFAALCIAAISLALRPNARMLAARSFLMRSGRTDRQTLRALASVLILCVLGDSLRLGAMQLEGGAAQLADQVAQLLVLLGSVLLTGGLVGVCSDCARLVGVIVEPPLSVLDVLGTVEPQRGAKEP